MLDLIRLMHDDGASRAPINNLDMAGTFIWGGARWEMIVVDNHNAEPWIGTVTRGRWVYKPDHRREHRYNLNNMLADPVAVCEADGIPTNLPPGYDESLSAQQFLPEDICCFVAFRKVEL